MRLERKQIGPRGTPSITKAKHPGFVLRGGSVISLIFGYASVGIKGQLKGGRNVRLCVGGDHRKVPGFILHKSRDAKTTVKPKLGAKVDIGKRAAVGNKLPADFLMAKAELNFIARVQPIGG